MTRRTIRIPAATAAVLLIAAGAALAATTPAVSTTSASGLTETGATLRGAVNPEGSGTTYFFQYGLTGLYGASTAPRSAGGGTKAVTASTAIGGLTPATVYHYRIVASNGRGESVGTDRAFKTTGHPLPTPVTGGASVIGHAFAVVNGTVTTQGQATTWTFQYGPSIAYGATSTGGSLPASAAPLPVSETLRGLSAGTVFHYRLVAFHGALLPPSYGADQTFYTLPFPRFKTHVKARTLPLINASKPYLFTTTGSISVPSAIPGGVACNGTVVIRFISNHRTRALRSVPVQPNCTFFSQVLFRRLVGGKARRLRVAVRFRGNQYLDPAAARQQRVRLGL
jgi:hypothetical protein